MMVDQPQGFVMDLLKLLQYCNSQKILGGEINPYPPTYSAIPNGARMPIQSHVLGN